MTQHGVFDSISTKELFELAADEPCAIINNHHLGNPNWENRVDKTSITEAEEVDRVQTASIHFEWASMMMRMFLPSNEPRKSKWSHAQGLVSHLQEFNGAAGGEDCTSWHSQHWRTDFSMSEDARPPDVHMS